MKIKGIEFSILQIVSLSLYYGFARHLPCSDNMWLGGEVGEYVLYFVKTFSSIVEKM